MANKEGKVCENCCGNGSCGNNREFSEAEQIAPLFKHTGCTFNPGMES